MRPTKPPSRLVGAGWKPVKGTDGFVLPYDADKKLLLPDPPEDLAGREFSRLWYTLQAMSSQNAEVLEREYGGGLEDGELEAEFGPRHLWGSKMSGDEERDALRYSEASTLRGEI